MFVPQHKVVFLSMAAAGPDLENSDNLNRRQPFRRGGVSPIRIVTNIWDTSILNIMKIPGYLLIAVFILLLAIVAGCTTPTIPQQTPAATQASTAASAQQTYSSPLATRAASTADIDTTVNVRFNELSCINVQDLLGTTYLYPDQKFKLNAASPGANTINVNVLFVDENDQLKLRQAKPKWDGVHNTWVYDGPVPLVQFIDITTPVEKTFTIKTQSKYYICADDRKESGTQDIVYRVPVKLTRV
jgi:hypothetical protein